MEDKKIEEAIKYAESTSKIEDMKPTVTELKMIKEVLEQSKGEESFLKSIVDQVKEEGKKNGKI